MALLGLSWFFVGAVLRRTGLVTLVCVAEFNAHQQTSIWLVRGGHVSAWCLTVAKTRCVACYTLSRHQVNDEFVAKLGNFLSRSRKIFLMVEYCCQLCGASANWITDFSGARLMRSERWHGIGFQIRAFSRPLMTQWSKL